MNLPPYITQYSGPSYDQRSSTDESYDYSGEDELVQQQDQVSGLRGAKFGALYGGDIPSSIAASERIRGLLDAIRQHEPTATEIQTMRRAKPLSRIKSSSVSTSSGGSGARIQGSHSLSGANG
jgi:hypothetical protein